MPFQISPNMRRKPQLQLTGYAMYILIILLSIVPSGRGGIVRNANCSTLELRAWASQVQGSQPKSDDSACSWQGLDKVGTRLGHGLDVKFTTR